MGQADQQPMTLKTLRIIWFALLASNFMYGWVLFMRMQEIMATPVEPNGMIKLVISFLAIAVYAVASLVPKNLLEKEKRKLEGKVTFQNLIDSYTVPFILKLALLESIAVMGFGLAVIQRDTNLFWPFAIVAVGTIIGSFPTEDKIKGILLDMNKVHMIETGEAK